jgi:hypothetical protein
MYFDKELEGVRQLHSMCKYGQRHLENRWKQLILKQGDKF